MPIFYFLPFQAGDVTVVAAQLCEEDGARCGKENEDARGDAGRQLRILDCLHFRCRVCYKLFVESVKKKKKNSFFFLLFIQKHLRGAIAIADMACQTPHGAVGFASTEIPCFNEKGDTNSHLIHTHYKWINQGVSYRHKTQVILKLNEWGAAAHIYFDLTNRD